MNIPLGFEVGTGARVSIPLGHTIVLGQTQLSGKTTTLQAMTERSGVCAIAFITKRGEKSFRGAREIPPYFTETSEIQPYWKFVCSLVESTQQVKLGFRERGWVMDLCRESGISSKTEDAEGKKSTQHHKWKKPKALRDVLNNAQIALDYSKGVNRMIALQLVEYLQLVVPEIEAAKLSSSIELRPGINVMDIADLSMHLQALVVRSVVEWVYAKRKNTVVIIPEAWKFLPEGRDTPVSFPVEELIRQGAVLKNFVWIDLQDLRGIKKLLLRSIQVWLFGVQREKNEVANTLKSMPTPEHKPSASEMMQLGIGQFIAAYGNELRRVYVWPAGMEETHAQAIALGQEDPKSWKRIARALDEREKDEKEAEAENLTGSSDDADGSGIPGLQPVRPVETTENSEDEMWKEKYEALKAQYDDLARTHDEMHRSGGLHDQLVQAHDALAARVVELEERIRTAGVADDVTILAETDPQGRTMVAGFPPPPNITKQHPASNGNHDLESIYRFVIDRAAKDPFVLLQLSQQRPELQISVERKKVQADGSTLRGALAILISEKYFDNAREFTDVRKDLIRRGFLGSKAPNLQISQALQGLVEWGFLTKEDIGYQAVAGMKINITEAK